MEYYINFVDYLCLVRTKDSRVENKVNKRKIQVDLATRSLSRNQIGQNIQAILTLLHAFYGQIKLAKNVYDKRERESEQKHSSRNLNKLKTFIAYNKIYPFIKR